MLFVISSESREFRFTTDSEISFQDPLIFQFLSAVENMNSVVLIDKIRVEKQLDSTYKYRLELTDGRLWKQNISFPEGINTEPQETFDITAWWKRSEFELHREVRKLIILLLQQHLLSDLRYSRI